MNYCDNNENKVKKFNFFPLKKITTKKSQMISPEEHEYAKKFIFPELIKDY